MAKHEPTKSVSDASVDLMEAMRERWIQDFPDGWPPDAVVANVYALEREFWRRLNEAKRPV